MLSSYQDTTHGHAGKRYKASIAAEQIRTARKELRALIKQLRQAIRDRKEQTRREVRESIERCTVDRTALRARIKAEKIEARQALKEKIRKAREDAACECRDRKKSIKDLGLSKRETDRLLLVQARHDLKMAKLTASHTAARAREAVKSTYAERRAEEDDRAMANLPEELRDAFKKRRKFFRSGEHKGRSESFQEWAATSEGKREITREIASAAERRAAADIAEFQRQEREAQRELRKAKPRAPATSAASRTLAITGTGGLEDYRLIPSPRSDVPARAVRRDPGPRLFSDVPF